jgi:hypothetical protein
MNVKHWLPLLALAVALLAAAVAQAGGPPAGEGANGCYQLFAGGTFTGETQLVANAKYNVTSLFKPGTNTFSLTLTNECGGIVRAPALYLVVSQH